MLRRIQFKLSYFLHVFFPLFSESSELVPTLVAGPQYSTCKNKILSMTGCLRLCVCADIRTDISPSLVCGAMRY